MREIGWGTEVNLLYSIKRKVNKMVEPCCSITTTSTTTSSLCPEGAIYSGWMTVGTDNDGFYGYYVDFGSIDPPLESIREIDWDSLDGKFYFNINEECNNPTVIVDGVEFSGFTWGGGYWALLGVSENPFAPVGELSSICILCGEELL